MSLIDTGIATLEIRVNTCHVHKELALLSTRILLKVTKGGHIDSFKMVDGFIVMGLPLALYKLIVWNSFLIFEC